MLHSNNFSKPSFSHHIWPLESSTKHANVSQCFKNMTDCHMVQETLVEVVNFNVCTGNMSERTCCNKPFNCVPLQDGTYRWSFQCPVLQNAYSLPISTVLRKIKTFPVQRGVHHFLSTIMLTGQKQRHYSKLKRGLKGKWRREGHENNAMVVTFPANCAIEIAPNQN